MAEPSGEGQTLSAPVASCVMLTQAQQPGMDPKCHGFQPSMLAKRSIVRSTERFNYWLYSSSDQLK